MKKETPEEILSKFVERPFRHTEIVSKENALKAMHQYAESIIREKFEMENEPNTKIEKPPIGVIPRRLWEEQRINELSAAIIRRANSPLYSVPDEWIEEYNELMNRRTM